MDRMDALGFPTNDGLYVVTVRAVEAFDQLLRQTDLRAGRHATMCPGADRSRCAPFSRAQRRHTRTHPLRRTQWLSANAKRPPRQEHRAFCRQETRLNRCGSPWNGVVNGCGGAACSARAGAAAPRTIPPPLPGAEVRLRARPARSFEFQSVALARRNRRGTR